MKTLYFFIGALLLTFTLNAQVSEEEFQAIKALYNSTGGNNWKNKTGWENINTTATKNDVTSNWNGLKVTNGHIVKINLFSNNLVGNLPPQIGSLKWVYELSVGSNKLEGLIPEAIGDLDALSNLVVSSNSFSSPLPEGLSKLKKLESIYIGDNPLNCPFPNDLFKKIPTFV